MYQTLVTLAALTSVLSPSMNYYSYITPKNDGGNFFEDNLKFCPKNFGDSKDYVTYKMMHLGEEMYKLVKIGEEDMVPVRLRYTTSSGVEKKQEESIQEPVLYLNADAYTQERPIFPLESNMKLADGVSEGSILPEKYHCHESRLQENIYKYNLDFGKNVKVDLTPEMYSHQIDIATDLCHNLINFKQNLDTLSKRPMVVINSFILDKFCFEMDLQKMELRISNFTKKELKKVEKLEKKVEKKEGKKFLQENHEKVVSDLQTKIDALENKLQNLEKTETSQETADSKTLATESQESSTEPALPEAQETQETKETTQETLNREPTVEELKADYYQTKGELEKN